MAVFKMEIKKVLKGKLFWLVIIFAVVLTVLSAVYAIQLKNRNFEILNKYGYNLLYAINDNTYSNTVYRDYTSITPAMFYRFIPLICVLAYGWSYSSDVRSGYIKSIITRTSKLKYLISKYFATFISGGLVVLIPILVNILTLACFMPFRMPSVFDSIYYSELPAFAFANLFYKAPALYMVIILIFHFILGGLFATFAMAVSMFTTNKYIVTLFPFVFSFLYSYVCSVFLNNFFWGEMDPLYLIDGLSGTYRVLEYLILVYGVFLILTAGTIFFKGMKKDVFLNIKIRLKKHNNKKV